MIDLEREVANIKSILSSLVRIGRITSTDDSGQRARVVFDDRDSTESYDLLVLSKNTLKNQDYAQHDIGEEVLCLFLPIGIEQGFIIGSYYSAKNTAPASDKGMRKTVFDDGTSVSYDRSTHEMAINVPSSGQLNVTINGPVNINATQKVTVSAPTIDLGQSGLEPMVLGDKLASWITSELKPWLDSHTHPGVGPPPSPFAAGSGSSGGAVYSAKNKTQ